MHASALANAKHFFDHYARPGTGRIVLGIGAQDVNGSLRSVAPTVPAALDAVCMRALARDRDER